MTRVLAFIAGAIVICGAAFAQPAVDAGGAAGAVAAAMMPEHRSDTPATMSIQQLVRIEGQGESQLRGMGIVNGLKGTGDSGSELVLARPLAELYKNSGNPIRHDSTPLFLATGRSSCTIPNRRVWRPQPWTLALSFPGPSP